MRHIITLLLMLPLLADAQIYIDSYRFGVPVPAPGLVLDSFPGAVAAFSFRRLSNTYQGNAIMVVRSSDKDSSNIGFSGNYLDTVSLKNFCLTGATDSCFVRTWYDQSGDGRHARQATYANMPKVMINGAILYKGNNVVMQRDSDFVAIPTNVGLASQSIFTAMSLNVAVDETTAAIRAWSNDSTVLSTNIFHNVFAFGVVTGNIANERHVWLVLADRVSPDPAIQVYGSGQTSTNLSAARYLWSHLYDAGTTVAVYKNGVQETMTNFTTGNFTSTIRPRSWNIGGANELTTQRNNSVFEVIVYPSYNTSNRAAIETNINTFYSIY
jgi:hypothetical protein